MGWRVRLKPEAQERIRAARGREQPEGLTDDQLAPLLDSVIDRHRHLGTLRSDEEAAAFRRYMAADLTGGAQALAEREQQLREAVAQRADANGDIRAARRPSDGQTIVAAAIKAGKFAEGRREFWLSRFRANPRQTTEIIEALQPLPRLIAKGSTDDDTSVVASISPKAAVALNAALAAGIDGAEALLERDRQNLARGFAHLAADRDGAAAAVLGRACRRTCMFRGPDEALLRLLAAADAVGVEHETALRLALRGALEASVPRL